MFVVLRDGTGFLQCVFSDKLVSSSKNHWHSLKIIIFFYQCQNYDAVILATEATISVTGVVRPVPEGQTAPGGQELTADFFQVVGHSPSGGADTLFN